MFDVNGDGPARYNIIHFKQHQPGKYRWEKVGEYIDGELRLNMTGIFFLLFYKLNLIKLNIFFYFYLCKPTEVQFKIQQPKPPDSVCSLPCERGQAKKYVEGESCCWHCFNCTQYQVSNYFLFIHFQLKLFLLGKAYQN